MLTFLGVLTSLLSLAMPASLAAGAGEEVGVPAGAAVPRFDFEHGALDGWTTVDGQWAVEEAADAPSGARARPARAAERVQRDRRAGRPVDGRGRLGEVQADLRTRGRLRRHRLPLRRRAL